MGIVFKDKDAEAYDLLMAQESRRYPESPLARILGGMFTVKAGQRLLDIGCGTGWFLRHLEGRGLLLTGLEPSPSALSRARARLAASTELIPGYGEDLPFADNSFDSVSLINTLEFVEDPAQVLSEAARVSRSQVFVVCLNRWAGRLLKERLLPGMSHDFLGPARLFSVWEIKRLVRKAMGDVPLRWDSACRLPASFQSTEDWLSRRPFFSGAHFGAVMAFCITVRPMFRVRPIVAPNGRARVEKAASGRFCWDGKRDLRPHVLLQRPSVIQATDFSTSP
ncbi:MAG: class I SAM-dependent methyltransferase [Thermodesulfobacteriota bacterium]